MRKFLKKVFLFSMLPVAFIVATGIGYIVFDPLKVLYKYDTYPIADINMNKDYISAELFLKNNKQQAYNSFIFGSSRTMGYNPESWVKHLPADAHPFCFDGYSENLFGIYHKIKYLDAQRVPINNVLILVDSREDYFDMKNLPQYIKMKHPATLNNSLGEWFDFHKATFLGYFNAKFLISYYGYEFLKIDHKLTECHRSDTQIKIKMPYNWMCATYLEEQIATDPHYYDKKKFLNRRKETYTFKDRYINDEQVKALKEIKSILDKHQSNYKIILNPTFNFNQYCAADLALLDEIFGKENVFDFSGKNYFSEPTTNFYDASHFRPFVGDSILKLVYKDN